MCHLTGNSTAPGPDIGACAETLAGIAVCPPLPGSGDGICHSSWVQVPRTDAPTLELGRERTVWYMLSIHGPLLVCCFLLDCVVSRMPALTMHTCRHTNIRGRVRLAWCVKKRDISCGTYNCADEIPKKHACS